MMDRCEETVKKTSRNILCWLKSTRPLSTYPKPFSLVRQPSSTKKYRLLWKKALLLVFRAYRLNPSVREKLTGIRLRKKLVGLLDLIWNHASWVSNKVGVGNLENYDDLGRMDYQYTVSKEEDEGEAISIEDDIEQDIEEDIEQDSDEDSDEDSGEDVDSTGDEVEEMVDDNSDKEGSGGAYETCENDTNGSNELQELLFGLSLALCTECPIDGQPSSMILVYFSGILGFSTSSKTFLPARSYTSHLSGLLHQCPAQIGQKLVIPTVGY